MKKYFPYLIAICIGITTLIGIHNTYTSSQNTPKIAILDTSAYLDHPDLAHSICGGYNFVTNEPISTTQQPTHFHGTHIAGIIAGNGFIKGVYPQAKLLYYVIDAPSDTAYQQNISRGIYRAIQDGASIINFSGRLPYDLSDTAILQAVDYARQNNAIFVKSCGNTGPDIFSVHDLASSENVFSIGAYDTVTKAIYPLSSRGPAFGTLQIKPDVVAPGVDILSTAPPSDGRYLKASGTSMSAAYTSGTLGLIRHLRPTLTDDLVIAALANNATPLTDENGLPYSVLAQGSGAINLDNTLEADVIFTPHHLSFIVYNTGMTNTLTRVLTATNTTSKQVTYFLTFTKEVASNAYTLDVPPTVTLAPFETKSIPITIRTTEGITPNHYTGRIYLSSDKATKNIPTLLEVPGFDFPVTRGLSTSHTIISFKQTPDFHLSFETSIPSMLDITATSLKTDNVHTLFENTKLDAGIHDLFWNGETPEGFIPDGIYELTGTFKGYGLTDPFNDLIIVVDNSAPIFQELSYIKKEDAYTITFVVSDLLLENSHIFDILYRDQEEAPPALVIAYSINGLDYTTFDDLGDSNKLSFSLPIDVPELYLRATDFAGNTHTEKIVFKSKM